MLKVIRIKIYKILRWSEKYAKTDMVYLAKGGGWLTLARVVGMATSLLVALAFANLLPRETYGTYRYLVSAIGILSMATLSGMGTAMTRAAARGFDGTWRPVVRTEIKYGLLGTSVALGVAIYYALGGAYLLAMSFFLVALFIPFINTFTVYGAFLSVRGRFEWMAKYDILMMSFQLFLVFPLLLFRMPLPFLITPYLLSVTVLPAVMLYRVIKQLKVNSAIDGEAVAYGKNLSVMGVISTLAMFVDQIVVYHVLGPVFLAVYAVALAPTEQIKGVFKMINTLALPKFAQHENLKSRDIYFKAVRFSLVIAIPTTMYIILAKWMFGILFPQYGDAVILTRWLALSLLFSAAIIPVTALQAKGRTKALYQWNILTSTLQIILIIIGALTHGLSGVVGARVLARAFDFCYAMLLVRRL